MSSTFSDTIVERPGRREGVAAARVDQLASFDTPDLEMIETRRFQLWALTLLLLSLSVAVLGLLAVWGEIVLPGWLPASLVHACLVGLVMLFCAYALEKETQLKWLTRKLIDERMLSVALTSRLRQADLLLEAGKAVSRGLDLSDVLNTILSSAVELLDGRDGSVMLVRSPDELRTVCTTDQSAARGAAVRFNQGIAGKVAANREPVLVSGTIEWDHYLEASLPRPSSAISVPLVHEDSLLGVLNINAGPDRSYNEHDLRALSFFGEQVAAAIANAQLYETQRLVASQTTYQALHDPLTRLPNRTLLMDRIATALARQRRDGRGVGLLFVDLDNFKKVNDSLGHAAGDKVLVAVAGVLQTAIRESDTAARFGGDEFAVLLDNTGTSEEAILTATRMQEALAVPVEVEDRKLRFSVSVGVVTDAKASAQPEELLRNALTALHEAKAEGKGRIVAFEPSMHSEAVKRLQLEEGLSQAVEEDRLALHYQPIVDLETRRVVAVEALVRWKHPTQGILPAASFIHIAEQAGLMDAIDRWVMENACASIGVLDGVMDAAKPIAMHVNVSPSTLKQPELADSLARCLDKNRIAPERLVVEITENLFLEESREVATRLSALRSLGVRLALDDFGTGYSSLSYLRRFPVDVVKIDRLFVEGLAKDHGAPALVQAIVSLGTGLAFEIVAEGVEEEAQAERLLELGCRYGQGFKLSMPLDGEELAAFLKSSPR